MNKILEKYARSYLRNNLSTLPKSYQILFKRMYGKNVNLHINKVVNAMSVDKLDWAMMQVYQTIEEM